MGENSSNGDNNGAKKERTTYKTEFRPPIFGSIETILVSHDKDLCKSQENKGISQIVCTFLGDYTCVVGTPENPLFHLEEEQISKGKSPFYDRYPGLGAEELFFVTSKNGMGTNAQSLELLISSFKERTNELLKPREDEVLLRQFYPYILYNPNNSSLFGRLLASQRIAPTIFDEIKGFLKYYALKERCNYCDIVQEEIKLANEQRANDGKYRLISQNENYISFVPFAPRTEYCIDILPTQPHNFLQFEQQYHIPHFTSLSKPQIKDLAEIIYDALERIKIVYKDEILSNVTALPAIEIVFHSTLINAEDYLKTLFYLKTPLNIQNDYKELVRTYGGIGGLYHFHVEIAPEGKGHYEIPGTGWTIIPERPKDMARKLRKAF